MYVSETIRGAVKRLYINKNLAPLNAIIIIIIIIIIIVVVVVIIIIIIIISSSSSSSMKFLYYTDTLRRRGSQHRVPRPLFPVPLVLPRRVWHLQVPGAPAVQ